jgi:hypothetical protein
VTTYTVVNARGRTVLPASDVATAALYRRIFDDKHGQSSHRVVAAEPGVRAPPPLAALLALPLLVTTAVLPAWAGSTERVSVSSGGVQGNGQSAGPTISADGRFVAFVSSATNLVPDDTNGAFDVFVRDRQAGVTEVVSVSSSDAHGDDVSAAPSLSAGGRFVAFSSQAKNLVSGDINGVYDVFVRDRQSKTTTRVSMSSSGAEGNGGSGNSNPSAISADGQHVVFNSLATNLVPGDTNEV